LHLPTIVTAVPSVVTTTWRNTRTTEVYYWSIGLSNWRFKFMRPTTSELAFQIYETYNKQIGFQIYET